MTNGNGIAGFAIPTSWIEQAHGNSNWVLLVALCHGAGSAQRENRAGRCARLPPIPPANTAKY